MLFIVVFLVNGIVKPDYDPVRDYVCEGSIGRGGWLQIAGLLVGGGLLLTFSFGLDSVVPRRTAWLVRICGVCVMAAGVFVQDPWPSTTTTGHGLVHVIVSLVMFIALPAACVTVASWRPSTAWRMYCLLTAVLMVVFLVLAVSSDPEHGTAGLYQRFQLTAGWSWVAVLGLRARHTLTSATPASAGRSAQQ